MAPRGQLDPPRDQRKTVVASSDDGGGGNPDKPSRVVLEANGWTQLKNIQKGYELWYASNDIHSNDSQFDSNVSSPGTTTNPPTNYRWERSAASMNVQNWTQVCFQSMDSGSRGDNMPSYWVIMNRSDWNTPGTFTPVASSHPNNTWSQETDSNAHKPYVRVSGVNNFYQVLYAEYNLVSQHSGNYLAYEYGAGVFVR